MVSQLQQPCSQETTREKQCLATSKECCPAQSFVLVLLYELFGIHCPNLPSAPRTGTCMTTFTFLLFCFFLLLSGAAFLPQGDQKVVQVVTCAERSKESGGSSALISRCTAPSPGKLRSPNSLPWSGGSKMRRGTQNPMCEERHHARAHVAEELGGLGSQPDAGSLPVLVNESKRL